MARMRIRSQLSNIAGVLLILAGIGGLAAAIEERNDRRTVTSDEVSQMGIPTLDDPWTVDFVGTLSVDEFHYDFSGEIGLTYNLHIGTNEFSLSLDDDQVEGLESGQVIRVKGQQTNDIFVDVDDIEILR